MLKLGKLPDRTPVKISVTLAQELNSALRDYAAVYRDTYGESESIADLIPFMLQAFLKTDKSFAKARKGRPPVASKEKPSRRGPHKKHGAEIGSSSSANSEI
jgi:hypothetical protein